MVPLLMRQQAQPALSNTDTKYRMKNVMSTRQLASFHPRIVNFEYKTPVTQKRNNFVDFLYQACQVLPESLVGQPRSFDLEALDRFPDANPYRG
jgi:hypothetical protein